MNCNECPLEYIGQTGRSFRTRYKEHIQAIRCNVRNSRLDTQHTYSTIENTRDMLHFEKKGPIMNTVERFHIYNLSKDKMQMNDTHTDTQPHF
jgi:hypothetical protein